MAPTLEAKAGRLLGDGAVQVVVALEDRIAARVRSDHHGIVDVAWSRLDGWHCTCPAWGRCCSHVEAVARVTTRSPRRPLSQPTRTVPPSGRRALPCPTPTT